MGEAPYCVSAASSPRLGSSQSEGGAKANEWLKQDAGCRMQRRGRGCLVDDGWLGLNRKRVCGHRRRRAVTWSANDRTEL